MAWCRGPYRSRSTAATITSDGSAASAPSLRSSASAAGGQGGDHGVDADEPERLHHHDRRRVRRARWNPGDREDRQAGAERRVLAVLACLEV
jgi:hypothetical protein